MIKVELGDIKGYLNSQIDDKMNKAVQSFIYVGEQCVIQSRNAGNYTDRTGNLRNSVGYVVLRDGIVQQKTNITKLNETITEELISEYNSGIVLIVVAGMNYAAYVEARNYDVLSSAELLAERLVPKFLKKLSLL